MPSEGLQRGEPGAPPLPLPVPTAQSGRPHVGHCHVHGSDLTVWPTLQKAGTPEREQGPGGVRLDGRGGLQREAPRSGGSVYLPPPPIKPVLCRETRVTSPET